MSDGARAMDEPSMKIGLLMESAQAHQKMAETHLERLRAHTQDLDEIVREEIRRTLIEELQSLTAESKRAVQALNNMKRAANMRGLLWSAAIAVLCTAIPSASRALGAAVGRRNYQIEGRTRPARAERRST